MTVVALGIWLPPLVLFAQLKPTLLIEEDCAAFAISSDNKIAYAVQRFKREKKTYLERDDVWVSTASGNRKKIVDGEKFMPVTDSLSYSVKSLTWSPDAHRLAVDMVTVQVTQPKGTTVEQLDEQAQTQPPPGGRVVALLDEDGREIQVQGSKTRFIENAASGAWLGDGATLVYLTGAGPSQIVRVRPSDGQTKTLFEGHSFDAVTWDAKRNQAYGVGKSLSITGHLALVQLDLLHETVREIARLESFQGKLSVSPSGMKVAYFEDGDTIEVRDLANPLKPTRVRAGMGRFEWSRDERRVLLKRGPEEKSNNLVWVGLYDGSFVPILHDLTFQDFEIMPDGESIAVTGPGKRVLKVFPLR